MAEHWEPLEARLRALGDQAIPLEVQARHLAAMAAVTPAPAAAPAPTWLRRSALSHPLRAAAAAAMVALLGSTGLASAGALPDTAQRIAHNVLEVVGIEVPDPGVVARPDGRLAPADVPGAGDVDPTTEAPATGGPTATESQATEPDAPASTAATAGPGAGSDPSSPPDTQGEGRGPRTDTGAGAGAGVPATDPTTPPTTVAGGEGPGGSCTGPPPWVTDPDMTKAEKDAAQADRRARCGSGPDGAG